MKDSGFCGILILWVQWICSSRGKRHQAFIRFLLVMTTFHVPFTYLQVVHTTFQVLLTTFQVLLTTLQVLLTTLQVVHTTFQVLLITLQVVHTTFQVLLITFRLVHTTFQAILTTFHTSFINLHVNHASCYLNQVYNYLQPIMWSVNNPPWNQKTLINEYLHCLIMNISLNH